MTSLIFDTETTGKCDFKAPPDAKHQPRVVQLAAMLIDDAGKELHSLNLIIRPAGFIIPKEASDIHGITTEMAEANGVSMQLAVELFAELATQAQELVAHNISFDMLMMRGECLRTNGTTMAWESRRQFCTMLAMTPICKLVGNYGLKWPKLQEAHFHAFGREFDGAHDALADVRACRDVLLWLRRAQPAEAA